MFTVINTHVFGQCCHFNYPHYFVLAKKQKVDHNGIHLCSLYIIFGAWRHVGKLLISILFLSIAFLLVCYWCKFSIGAKKSGGSTSQLTRFLVFWTSWHFIPVINCICSQTINTRVFKSWHFTTYSISSPMRRCRL